MSCGCKETNQATERELNEVLERVGLREIVAQGRGAMDAASTALDHLMRAERARALGFGDDVARMHHETARRHNRWACDQLGFLADRIDARIKADDWRGLAEEAQGAFGKHGGRDRLDDARAEVRMLLLDERMGAAVSEQALALFDRVAEQGRDGNLTSVLEFMRDSCMTARKAFASDEMGRQAAAQAIYLDHRDPPPVAGGQNVNGWCVALAACLAWAYSSLIASLIACFVIPFCWCCFHVAVLATFAVHQLGCLLAFNNACMSG